MLKTLLLTGFVLITAVLPAVAQEGVFIEVKDPAQIALLSGIGDTIDAIAGLVTKCVSAEKLEASVCQCRFKGHILALKNLHDVAVANNPTWADAQVNYPTPDAKEKSRTISFAGVKANATVSQGCQ